MSNETVKLADFCSRLRFEQLPEAVVEKAKDHLLDTLGCAIAGRPMESSRPVIGLVRSMGGREEALVIGEALRVPMAQAAFANGTMAHGVELDDTHRWTYLHAGASIVPATLAVAESRCLGGRELLTAIVAGYEAAIRVALAVNPSHRRRGFHTSGTVGTIGATAAASRAMALDPATTASALGIGATQAAGLFEFLAEGAMTKRLHPGRAAQNGVYAALLASGGFVGPRTILEGANGFCRAMSDEPDLSSLTRNLGTEFKILEMGIKPYASCRFCHASIDAAREIVATTGPLRPDQIVEVVDTVSPLNAAQTGDASPATFMAAQMSTPFSLGLVLAGLGAGFSQYLSGLENPGVMEIARKVRLAPEPALGETGRRVELTVRLADGRSLSSAVDLPSGEPERPIGRQGLREKFIGLATTTMSRERAERIADEVTAMDRATTLEDLIALIRGADEASG